VSCESWPDVDAVVLNASDDPAASLSRDGSIFWSPSSTVGGAGAYVAVYVVAVAGATMLCVCAPPSDHDENAYVVPFSVCGELALTELDEFTITVRVNGAVPLLEPTASCSPLGLEANVRSTVRGSRRTLVVLERPPESVAVSCSSRYDG
jgi:hypothetical protein